MHDVLPNIFTKTLPSVSVKQISFIHKRTQNLVFDDVGQPLDLNPPASLNFLSLAASAPLQLIQIQGASLSNSQILNPFVYTGIARLCKQEQPSGVKLKYWFGVGQILVGILSAPFSIGTSSALILSGTAMVVDAASDALNNKESWERELNERQRMYPDFQQNSFFYDSSKFNLTDWPKVQAI